MPRTSKSTSSNPALYAFDAEQRARFGTICGVDEAGRGPLCGPVCCAAVILDPDDPEGSFHRVYERRDSIYRSMADLIVDLGPYGDKERIADMLAEKLRENGYV